MAGIGNQVGIQQEAPKTRAEVTQTHNSFSVSTATALLALSLVAGQAGAESKKVDPLQTEAQSTLLAQAEIGQTWPYTAEVIQVDGTRKVIKYFRDKNWLIIPPLVENGKLINGENAPTDPLRAKIAQRKILTQYDKLILVMADKKDLVVKASGEIGYFTTLAEQSRLDKNGLYQWFSLTYLVKLWLGNEATPKNIEWLNTILDWFGKYWKVILKMSLQEIEQMRKKAEQDAQNKLDALTPSAA